MSNRKHLTDTLIRNFLPTLSKGDRVEWADDVPPFLRVRLSASGAVFYWVGRNPTTRKPERHKLGLFPAMSVRLAREAATKVKGAAHEGKNIVKHKREAKRATDSGRMTVAGMRDGYLARCEADGKPLAPKTQLTYTATLPQLLGEYMDLPIDALDSETLMQLVTKMGKPGKRLSKHGRVLKSGNKGGSVLGVKALARLCKVYKIVDDPTKALREERRLPKIGARQGRLGSEEAMQLFAWLHWYAQQETTAPYKVRCARMFMVAIVTGWRISTVQAWRWEEIDFTAMTTKLPANKSGHEQTLPLWPVLADVFKPLKEKSGPVFDGAWQCTFVDEMPWKVSPHDARKAFSSAVMDVANDGGIHAMSLELLMQHFNSVTVKHYVMRTPIPDQVRNLRPAVAKVSAMFARKLGHKATIKALDALAVERATEAKATEAERRRPYWATEATRRRERRAAI